MCRETNCRVLPSSLLAALTVIVGGCDAVNQTAKAEDAGPPDPQTIVRDLAEAKQLKCVATFDQTKIEFAVSDAETLKKLSQSMKFKGEPKRREPGKFSALEVLKLTIVRDDGELKMTLIGGVVLLYGPELSYRVDLESLELFNQLSELAFASQRERE